MFDGSRLNNLVQLIINRFHHPLCINHEAWFMNSFSHSFINHISYSSLSYSDKISHIGFRHNIYLVSSRI